jgi:hypothetical protein
MGFILYECWDNNDYAVSPPAKYRPVPNLSKFVRIVFSTRFNLLLYGTN